MRTRIAFICSLCVLMYLSFVGTASAAGAIASDDSSLLDMIRPAYDAIMAGHYVAAAALALVLAMAAFKRYAPGRAGEFAHTDAGGALCTLVMAFGGGLAMATASGQGWSGLSSAVLLTSLKVAATAAGGYTLLKKLVVEPLLASAWYKDRAPAWLKTVLAVAMFAFVRKDNGATAKAEAAGAQATKDKPAEGAESAIGKPTEL